MAANDPFEGLLNGALEIGFALVKEGLGNMLLFAVGGELFRLLR